MDNKVLIVGIGNGLRQDDGAGPALASRLEASLQGRRSERLTVITHAGDGLSLMEAWGGFHQVVIVDAARSGARPGTVYRFEVGEEDLPHDFCNCSSHQFGIAETIALARVLRRLPRRLVVYGIEGARFGRGEGLSPEVSRGVEEVARAVLMDIASLPVNPVRRESQRY